MENMAFCYYADIMEGRKILKFRQLNSSFTTCNIVLNQAGGWAAKKYLLVKSEAGNIILRCDETDVQGRYDTMKSYKPPNAADKACVRTNSGTLLKVVSQNGIRQSHAKVTQGVKVSVV